MHGRRIRVAGEGVDIQGPLHGIARCPLQDPADTPVIDVLQPVGRPGYPGYVLGITVPIPLDSGNAQRQRVAQGDIHASLEVDLVESTVGHCAFGLEFIARFLGDEIYCSTGRIAAVQRALRTAQDLHALQIEHLRQVRRAGTGEHFVVVNPDRNLLERRKHLLRAHAAYRYLGLAMVVKARDLHVGCMLGDVEQVLESVFPEFDLAESRDGQRNILHRLLAFLRRHDNFFKCLTERGQKRQE